MTLKVVTALRAYAGDLTLRLGPASTQGKLVGLRKTISKEEKAETALKLCTPDGKPVKQRYIEVDENEEPVGDALYIFDSLGRAKVVDGQYILASDEEIEAAKNHGMNNNILNLTVHSADECEGMIHPANTQTYAFWPGKKGKNDWDRGDDRNEEFASLILDVVSKRSFVFLSHTAISNSEGLYRVFGRDGLILVQKQMYPGELNTFDFGYAKVPQAAKRTFSTIIGNMAEPFDPDKYVDQKANRLRAVGTGEAIPAPKVAAKSDDLMALLEASLLQGDKIG